MIKTKKATRKKIDELKMDLEIINPIESKNLLGGGDLYGMDGGTIQTVNIPNYAHNQYVNQSDNHYTSYNNDWNNYGGGGGSGGGSNNSTNNSGNIIDPGEGTLANPSPHICIQVDSSSTCATMALSYVANYFGATGLSSSDFAEIAQKSYLGMVNGSVEGLNGIQLHNIMASVFQSTILDGSYNSIISNLNSGHPVLAAIDQGGGIGHEVVIININDSGTVTYMDPLVGIAVTSSVSSINFLGEIYAVTGVKDNDYVNYFKHDTNDIVCGICGH